MDKLEGWGRKISHYTKKKFEGYFKNNQPTVSTLDSNQVKAYEIYKG